VDPVPDPLLLRKNLVAPGIEPGPLDMYQGMLTTRPPSDTHRKPITAITAVLLPFVSYLLTLPRTTIGPRGWCLV
jgi:hypothetical protein